MHIEYIDTSAQLSTLCKKINQAQWIALDTEFVREKTYYAKFCLLQIATLEWVACVDPIALTDLTELFSAINNPKITKILHSCYQDLEIFYHLTKQVPSPIFDTQIAATLLGFQDNNGYAALISSLLNINLPKIYTRTNWYLRPLSSQQIQYAANDVIYLCKIYPIMLQRIKDLDRLKWLDKECKLLTNVENYAKLPSNAWLKVKGRRRLTGSQLAVVQALCAWREQSAQEENRPKNWLIRDDVLIELAKLQPLTIADMSKILGVNQTIVRLYGEKICQLIAKAQNQSPILPKDEERSVKKTPKQKAVMNILTAIVRIRADENSLNPTILADKKNLEKLLFQEADTKLLQDWRYSMVGKELQDFLQEKCSLTLSNGTIVTSYK